MDDLGLPIRAAVEDDAATPGGDDVLLAVVVPVVGDGTGKGSVGDGFLDGVFDPLGGKERGGHEEDGEDDGAGGHEGEGACWDRHLTG